MTRTVLRPFPWHGTLPDLRSAASPRPDMSAAPARTALSPCRYLASRPGLAPSLLDDI